eukprot:5919636-Amphidinium_carterae.1
MEQQHSSSMEQRRLALRFLPVSSSRAVAAFHGHIKTHPRTAFRFRGYAGVFNLSGSTYGMDSAC